MKVAPLTSLCRRQWLAISRSTFCIEQYRDREGAEGRMKETTQDQITPRPVSRSGVTTEREEEQLLFESVQTAVQAAEEKKAEEIAVLKLAAITSFTDYFVICS